MEFLGKLGIDWHLLIAQIINFGILLWLLNKFLYSPIIGRIEKDEAELNKAKIQKGELSIERDLFEKRKKEKIVSVKEQAESIIREAESIAKTIVKKATDETRKERELVIKQIKSRLSEVENDKKNK